jgi:hypothetical protein
MDDQQVSIIGVFNRGYRGCMTKSAKSLKRWIVGLVVFETILAVSLWLMPDGTTGPKVLFLLFVLAANLPGIIVANLLGLGSKGYWGQYPDPHPVITGMVVFGVSLLFYIYCIWMIQAALYRKRSLTEHKGAEPGHGKDGQAS